MIRTYSESPHFTEAPKLEIIQLLLHEGAITCTSKEGRRLVDEAGVNQCCPCQQFYHPKDAALIDDPNDTNISFEYTFVFRHKSFLDEDT